VRPHSSAGVVLGGLAEEPPETGLADDEPPLADLVPILHRVPEDDGTVYFY
jgi:hypothetical protein